MKKQIHIQLAIIKSHSVTIATNQCWLIETLVWSALVNIDQDVEVKGKDAINYIGGFRSYFQ